ncbi:hypothetical protein SAMN02990966_07025 [Rhodospirillales bacterium URHD0017]|nr:hypothetical protein SAMN02990966_07025 [Rhodospirillales bacterium URHD0017]
MSACASPGEASSALPSRAARRSLQGYVDVFVEGETGNRVTTRLGPWDCISCPAGVIQGYQNDGLEPVYMQVMLGRGKPETMGYTDEELYKRRDAHLKAL